MAAACLISRDEQDEFALQSQLKCAHAMSLGHFDAEIEPIVISTARSMLIFFYEELLFLYSFLIKMMFK